MGFTAYSLYVLASALPTPRTQESNFILIGRQLYDIYKCFDSIDQQSLVQQCLYDRSYSFAMTNYGAFVILAISPVVGFFAALTWASQGFFCFYFNEILQFFSFLLKSSTNQKLSNHHFHPTGSYVTAIAFDPLRDISETGFFSGTFFSIYQSNLIFANSFVVLMIYLEFNIYYIFLMMFFVGIAGMILSLFLWPYNTSSASGSKDQNKNTQKKATRSAYQDIEMKERTRNAALPVSTDGIGAKIIKGIGKKSLSILKDTKDGLLATFSVTFDKRMILMGPICFYSGMSGSLLLFFCIFSCHRQWLTDFFRFHHFFYNRWLFLRFIS